MLGSVTGPCQACKQVVFRCEVRTSIKDEVGPIVSEETGIGEGKMSNRKIPQTTQKGHLVAAANPNRN